MWSCTLRNHPEHRLAAQLTDWSFICRLEPVTTGCTLFTKKKPPAWLKNMSPNMSRLMLLYLSSQWKPPSAPPPSAAKPWRCRFLAPVGVDLKIWTLFTVKFGPFKAPSLWKLLYGFCNFWSSTCNNPTNGRASSTDSAGRSIQKSSFTRLGGSVTSGGRPKKTPGNPKRKAETSWSETWNRYRQYININTVFSLFLKFP